MKKIDRRNLPNYVIAILLILVFPLGVYFLTIKTYDSLKMIKRTSKVLKLCGYLALVIFVFYLIINLGSYISLFDSHMSFEMYSFKFLYLYIYALIVIISTLVGGYYLDNKCSKLIIYTEFINVKHIKDIKMIADETGEDLETVKKVIQDLISKKYLLSVKLSEDKLITESTDKDNYVKCSMCGTYMKKSKKVRCDFCDNKIKL